MARNYATHTPTAAIALGAATRTCVARIDAPANQIVAVNGIDIEFDGIVVTDKPVLVEVLRVTSAGTGMSARNPLQTKPKATAIQTTGAVGPVTAGNLPTASDVLRTFFVHPQAGVFYPWQRDLEIEIAGGGRLAVFLTAPAAVNALTTLALEE